MQSDWSADVGRRIEQSIETAFAACPPTEVLRAARYATLGGGHRWRGRMAVAAGAIFRADAEEIALPLAAALEMLQAASLVLDDLPSMDNAATRRGRACVHLVFPDWAVALLPAFLVNVAYQVVAGHAGVCAAGRIRALLLLGETGTRLAQGQELDLAPARKSASEIELLECYALKSGSLFGPVAARARAEKLLEEAARMLDRFGPAAGSLRGLLDQILA